MEAKEHERRSSVQGAVKGLVNNRAWEVGDYTLRRVSVHTDDQTGWILGFEVMHNCKEQVQFPLGAAEH